MEPCPRCSGGEPRNACPDCHGEGYTAVEHPEWDAQDHPELDEEIAAVGYPASRISLWIQPFLRPREPADARTGGRSVTEADLDAAAEVEIIRPLKRATSGRLDP
jgi:hypothetical protein